MFDDPDATKTPPASNDIDADDSRWASSEVEHSAFESLVGHGTDGITDMGEAIRYQYGENSRGGPDTKAAADALGVTQRTVQRWIKGQHAPGRENTERVDQMKTEATEKRFQSPEWRAQQITEKQRARIEKQGLTISAFSGMLRVSKERRHRDLGSFKVEDPDTRKAILDAQMSGDQEAIRAAYEDAISANVVGGQSVSIDALHDISLKPGS